MDHIIFSSLVEELYEEALSRGTWRYFLIRLASELGILPDAHDGAISTSSKQASAVDITPQNPQLRLNDATFTPHFLQSYMCDDFSLNGFFNLKKDRSDNSGLASIYWDSEPRSDRSETSSHRGLLIFHNVCKSLDFERLLNSLNLLSPHMNIALKGILMHRFSHQRQNLHAITDTYGCAAFIVDSSLVRITGNEYATQMIANGEALIASGRLLFRETRLMEGIYEMMEDLTNNAKNINKGLGFCRTGERENGYQARLGKIQLTSAASGKYGLLFLLLIKKNSEDPLISHAALKYLFRLTATESEVVCLLCSGKSTLEISKYLKVMESTIRGHVKSIFSKIGVSRQSELVTVVLTSLAAKK